jgi:probable F420-dependent oxidoreductase
MRSTGTRRELAERARRAEALGYSTVVVPDHLTALPSPFLALLAAADATTTLRVGTFVLNNDFRHPVLVAREAATLDLLSEGRLELGLGAGHMAAEYREAGMRYDPAGVRVERLGEAVEVIQGLLTGEPLTFEGSHYRVDGHRVHPQPVQAPVPLLIGGNGPRLLTLAAQRAQIVGLIGFSFRAGGTRVDLSAFDDAGTAAKVALVREAAGARLADLELNALMQRVVVTDDPRGTAEEIAGGYAPLGPDDLLASPYLLLGPVEWMAEALRERRERHGFSYVVVPEAATDAFAPVVAQLTGT